MTDSATSAASSARTHSSGRSLNKVRTIKLNPIAINNFLGAAVKSLTIDTTFSESDLINLIEQFHDMTSNNLHTETLPTVGHTTTTGADVLERVEPDDDKMIAAFNAIGTATGTTSTSKGKSTSTTTSTTWSPLRPSPSACSTG